MLQFSSDLPRTKSRAQDEPAVGADGVRVPHLREQRGRGRTLLARVQVQHDEGAAAGCQTYVLPCYKGLIMGAAFHGQTYQQWALDKAA